VVTILRCPTQFRGHEIAEKPPDLLVNAPELRPLLQSVDDARSRAKRRHCQSNPMARSGKHGLSISSVAFRAARRSIGGGSPSSGGSARQMDRRPDFSGSNRQGPLLGNIPSKNALEHVWQRGQIWSTSGKEIPAGNRANPSNKSDEIGRVREAVRKEPRHIAAVC
jgi:hypothetical protein